MTRLSLETAVTTKSLRSSLGGAIALTKRFHSVHFQRPSEIGRQVGVASGYLEGGSCGCELAVIGAPPCDNLALAFEREMRPRDLDEECAEGTIPTNGNRGAGVTGEGMTAYCLGSFSQAASVFHSACHGRGCGAKRRAPGTGAWLSTRSTSQSI